MSDLSPRTSHSQDAEKGEKTEQAADTHLAAASLSSLEAMAVQEGIKPIFLAKVTYVHARASPRPELR